MPIDKPFRLRSSIRSKLVIPLVLLLLIVIVTFSYLLFFTTRTRELIEREISRTRQVYQLTNRLNAIRDENMNSLLSYRFSKDVRYVEIINRNEELVNGIISEMRRYVSTPFGMNLLDNYITNWNPLQEARRQFIEAIRLDDADRMRQYYLIWQIHSENASAALEDLTNYNFQSFERSDQLYSDLSARIYSIAVILTIMTGVSTIAIYFYIRSIVTKPIRRIAAAAQRIASGDFTGQIPFRSRDELGLLATSINRMATELSRYYAHLEQEVRQKEAELKRARHFEAQKDDFLNIASHELKTPVTSLKVFEQMMLHLARKRGDHEYVTYLQKMDTQINKLVKLIENLLDVTKIQSGKMQYEMESFDFNRMLSDVVEVFLKLEENHRIELSGRVRRKVIGDEDRLSQVMSNLISNGIKYSPDSGRLSIQIRNGTDRFRVSVRDYGIGIKKSQKLRIFERFYRAVESQDVTFPGLGIGLYISAKIVKRHHGRIWVESDPGKGSTFTVEIPYRQ